MVEKEGDWATLGGIANGIVDSVPGLATALEVQRHNAEIRATEVISPQSLPQWFCRLP